jgi:hypothetical protein
MTLKIVSALIAFMLAVSPVLGQTPEQLAFPRGDGQPDADQPTPPPPPPSASPYNGPLTYTPSSTERWWIEANYLMGFVQPVHIPALVTTSPSGTAQSAAGVLGPNASVLFGDRDVDGDMRSGFRVGFGAWFNDDRTLGFNAGFFWLTGLDQSFSASSNGNPILARPFIDANTGAQTTLLVAYPGLTHGSIAISASSGSFYGAHFDFQESIIDDPGFRLKSLLGYRFIHFADGLDITQNTDPTGGSPAPQPGTHIYSQDSFSAQSTFNGVEIGLEAEIIRGPFAATILAKIAAGNMQRTVNIGGNTLITAPGAASVSTPGGLLALPTNMGSYDSNVFAVMPEIGLTLSYNVTPNLRVSAGYSILVLNHAVRAADQIDTTVNSNLLNSGGNTTGAIQRPNFALEQSNPWVQTINLGLEFRY